MKYGLVLAAAAGLALAGDEGKYSTSTSSVCSTSSPTYPTSTPTYPVSTPTYPASSPSGYPTSSPSYPASSPSGYPTSSPSYPTSSPHGYPTTWPTHPTTSYPISPNSTYVNPGGPPSNLSTGSLSTSVVVYTVSGPAGPSTETSVVVETGTPGPSSTPTPSGITQSSAARFQGGAVAALAAFAGFVVMLV